VVARHWRGWTWTEDADRYVEYLNETGVPALAGTDGNRGVQVWLRREGERAEFVVLSLWESRESIRAFAGEDIETARFYPEDERFLVERDLTCTHYDVVSAA
jgi:heme-degrading monooxygenase HmoA